MAVDGIHVDAVSQSGRDPVSKHDIQPECGERVDRRWTGWLNPSREANFACANEDREQITSPVELNLAIIPGQSIFYFFAQILITYEYILYTRSSWCASGCYCCNRWLNHAVESAGQLNSRRLLYDDVFMCGGLEWCRCAQQRPPRQSWACVMCVFLNISAHHIQKEFDMPVLPPSLPPIRASTCHVNVPGSIRM